VKGLLQKLAGAMKGLIDLDGDGKIEVTEVLRIGLTVAPILAPAAMLQFRERVGVIASLGRVVSETGEPWTRDQALTALDVMIAAADKLIDTAEADSARVRAILAGQAATGSGLPVPQAGR
jgi:hypothetical protein